MSRCTVLGAGGFIGSHVVQHLEKSGRDVDAPARAEDVFDRDLGFVVDCAGLTADFRTRPLDAISAHVCRLTELLTRAHFSSLIYLSSTRLYGSRPGEAGEPGPFCLDPAVADDLYGLSKAMGEAACHASQRPTVILRLSNVYGMGAESSFLSSLITDALRTGRIEVGQEAGSSKDYISVGDVVQVIEHFVSNAHPRYHAYNVASGKNVRHGALVDRLREITGCSVGWEPRAPKVSYPRIPIRRLREEMVFSPRSVLDDLPELVAGFRQRVGS